MKTATMHWLSAICGLAAVPIVEAGCDNHHLLGAVDGGGGTGGTQAQSMDAGSPDMPGSAPDGAVTTFAESWTGYIENYSFASGSDAVRMSFTTDAGGQVAGIVRLGSGTPPPPPTDPNVGYPADLLSTAPGLSSVRSYIAEGLAYPMHSATNVAGRLRFTVAINDLWRDWCAIQTPAGTSGACLPNASSMSSADNMNCGLFDAAANQYLPVDCGKLALCGLGGGVCRCDTQTCMVSDDGDRIAFDLTFDNLRASGSTTLNTNNNVHFTKDP